jgi:hypothetical protein
LVVKYLRNHLFFDENLGCARFRVNLGSDGLSRTKIALHYVSGKLSFVTHLIDGTYKLFVHSILELPTFTGPLFNLLETGFWPKTQLLDPLLPIVRHAQTGRSLYTKKSGGCPLFANRLIVSAFRR